MKLKKRQVNLIRKILQRAQALAEMNFDGDYDGQIPSEISKLEKDLRKVGKDDELMNGFKLEE